MSTKLEFITQVSTTGVAFLNTGQIFSAQYDNYFIQLELASSSTYNEIYMTDSSNNKLTTAKYDQAMLVMKSNTSFTEHRDTGASVGWREFGAYIDNEDEGYGMSFYLFNPFDSSKYTFGIAQSASMVSNVLWGGKAVALYESAEQCNGLYLTNSGTVTMDYIRANIYGVK
tara:strand:- start:18 stop:530 length:513 start_codon:yes stop_codon:yes gene_type:complete